MIVVDASAWVDVSTGLASDELATAVMSNGHWVVPEHFRLEAMNTIRGRWLGGQLTDVQVNDLTAQLMEAPVDIWPTAPLLPRVRALAANANSYDASYIALAEELGCTLVASDAKLSRIPGIRCRVIGFAGA